MRKKETKLISSLLYLVLASWFLIEVEMWVIILISKLMHFTGTVFPLIMGKFSVRVNNP